LSYTFTTRAQQMKAGHCWPGDRIRWGGSDSVAQPAGHLKLIDLASVDSLVPGFAGAGIAEVAEVQQLCDLDGDGDVDQTPIMPSVVVVNKGPGPGDVTEVYEGIPVK
jgi:hypothetical protein